MKALIYKDLVALKKTGLLSLVILAVVCFIGIRQEAVLMLPFIFVLVPVILLGILFGSDTQSRVDSYIIPGPVKRSTIVLSRYSFVWLLALIGILFTVILKIFTGDGALEKMPWHLIVATMLLLTTFIAAIQIPLMYKFGAEQGRLVFVVLYFIIFALFSYIGGKKEFMLELMSKLGNFNLSIISLTIIAITIVINAISYAISVAIYARKEF
jgi:ABC-2 type transport system permease protein